MSGPRAVVLGIGFELLLQGSLLFELLLRAPLGLSPSHVDTLDSLDYVCAYKATVYVNEDRCASRGRVRSRFSLEI